MTIAAASLIATVASSAVGAISSIQQGQAAKAQGEALKLQSQAEFDLAQNQFEQSLLEQEFAELDAQAFEEEAAQLELQADIEATRAAQDEARRQKRINSILSSQRALFAGRGIQPGTGTPLAFEEDSLAEFEEDQGIAAVETSFNKAQIRNAVGQKRLQASGARIEGGARSAAGLSNLSLANASLAKGRAAESAGNASLLAGYAGAFSSIASGASGVSERLPQIQNRLKT